MNSRQIPGNIQFILSRLNEIKFSLLIGGSFFFCLSAKCTLLEKDLERLENINKELFARKNGSKIDNKEVRPISGTKAIQKPMDFKKGQSGITVYAGPSLSKSSKPAGGEDRHLFYDNKALEIRTPSRTQTFSFPKIQATQKPVEALFDRNESLEITTIDKAKNIQKTPNKADFLKKIFKKPSETEKTFTPPIKKETVHSSAQPQVPNILTDMANLGKNLEGESFVFPTGSALFGMKQGMKDLSALKSNRPIRKENKIESNPAEAGVDTTKGQGKVGAKRSTLKDQKQQSVQFSEQFIVPKNVGQKTEEAKNPTVQVIAIPVVRVPAKVEPSIKAPERGHLAEVISKKVQESSQTKEAEPSSEEKKQYEEMPVVMIKTSASPQVQFSGDICSYMGVAAQEDTRGGKEGDLHLGFGWADLIMKIAGATSGDIQYQYLAKLEIVPASGIAISENYFEIQSQYGTFQAGNFKGPDGTFCGGAEFLLGGTGGIDGSFRDLYNEIAGLPSSKQLGGYTKRATKFVYYSPRFLGLQAGLGFCPNPHHIGWEGMGSNAYASSNSNDDGVFHTADIKRRNNVAIGLNFKQDLNEKIAIEAAAVAVREQSSLKVKKSIVEPAEVGWQPRIASDIEREIPLKKDTSFQLSSSIKCGNAQIAAGLIDNGSINLPSNRENSSVVEKFGLHTGNSGKSWNVGGKYTIGCFDLGIAHHNTTRRVTSYHYAQSTITSFTVDCQIVSGIKIFAEINHIDAKTSKEVTALYSDQARPSKNKGTVVMVGSKVSF